MIHASPSLGLAKFLWSKPVQSSPAPMTVSANGEAKPEPMKLDAHDNNLDIIDSSTNSFNGMSQTSGVKSSTEEKSYTLTMAGLKEFWNHHMKASEEKWKQFFEQKGLNQQYPGYDTETGEIDWEAVKERIAWRWRLLSQEKPENMSSEDWQKLQEINVTLRPWFIYKTCGMYSRIVYDPESRPIFQEFDFY